MLEEQHGRGSSRIRAVIFDCDGVLVESRQANAAFYNTILSHFNREPLTEEELSYVHSHTLEQSLAFLFKDSAHRQQALQYWQNMDYGPILALLTLQPGLRECLRQLHGNYHIAVATNRTTTMKGLLRRFALEPYFDMVVTSLDVSQPKPHPESIDKIISFFQIDRQEACYVGDSAVDQETALRAGVCFIAYRNRELQADYHLSHFSQLVPLLERMAFQPGKGKLSSSPGTVEE